VVFTSPDCGVLRYTNFLHRVWRPALRSVGLPPFGIRVLRHSAAAAMIHGGGTPKAVQMALGHANAGFTLTVYAHVFDADMDALADGMGRVVLAARTGSSRDLPEPDAIAYRVT
jgi:integrase